MMQQDPNRLADALGLANVNAQTINELRVLSAPEWSLTGTTNVAESNNADYTIALIGTELLLSGESVSVVVSLTDIDTDSADYADFDTAMQTAVSKSA